MSEEQSTERPLEKDAQKKDSVIGKILKWNAEKKAQWREKLEKSKKEFEESKKKYEESKKMFDPGLLVCPECGSEDLQIVTETSTSGRDFSAGNACCGYFLLGGPLGLLCGACGTGKQTKSDTFFICKGCGKKFKKLTMWAMMNKSDAWLKRYASFQAAARKRRGLEPEAATAQPSQETSASENVTPTQNP